MNRIVPDCSLEPEIPCGAAVRCSDSRIPRSGDFVVYEPLSGTAVFRRYTVRPDGKILLQAVNPKFDSYVSSRSEMRKRGRLFVIESFEKIFYPDSPDNLKNVFPESSDYLTFTETMRMLKIGRTNLYGLLQSGKLPASKVGKLWRIPRAAVEACLKG